MKIKQVIKEMMPYVIILLVVILIRLWIITPVIVDGSSMSSTLKDNDILLLKKYDHSFERFDIVVVDFIGEKLIKRVIGLPGEHIEYKNSKLYINGKKIDEKFINQTTEDFKLEDIGYSKIPKNMYFIVGDNRNNSQDSRIIGLIPKEDIEGTVTFRLWPFGSVK